MPFKSKYRPGVWRGQVKWQGKMFRADFRTRREAADWETGKRQELQEASQARNQTVTDFLNFSNSYLDDAKLRFTKKTYAEKKSLCETLLALWGNPNLQDITPETIRQYLNAQAQTKSANCYNRDRKNLLAMWTWGMNILGLDNNPVAKIKRLPHDRTPQYTPPTEHILKVLAAANREERIFSELLPSDRRPEIRDFPLDVGRGYQFQETRSQARNEKNSGRLHGI